MDRTLAETSEGTDPEEYIPPCRLAGFYRAPCPLCGRQLTLKVLRYSHLCGRSFNPQKRALELQIEATKAINARMIKLEQPIARQTEHITDKRLKYANLINF